MKKVCRYLLASTFLFNALFMFGMHSYADELYDIDENGVIIKYKGNGVEEVNVPETIDGIKVKGIGKEAFRGGHGEGVGNLHWEIKKISLPKTVKSIGEHSFSNLKQLESIEGVDNVEFVGAWAFDRDYKLMYPFSNNNVLKSFDGGFGYTFYRNKLVNENDPVLKIQDSIENIGKYNFNDSEASVLIFGKNLKLLGEKSIECSWWTEKRIWLPNTLNSYHKNVKLNGEIILYGVDKEGKEILKENEYKNLVDQIKDADSVKLKVGIIDSNLNIQKTAIQVEKNKKVDVAAEYGVSIEPLIKFVAKTKKDGGSEEMIQYSKLYDTEKAFCNEYFDGGYFIEPEDSKIIKVADNGSIIGVSPGKTKLKIVSRWNKEVYKTVEVEVLGKDSENNGESPYISDRDINKKTLFLVNSNAFSDALVASPYADKLFGTILFTNKDKITNSTYRYIEETKPNKVIIVGGEKSISSEIFNSLKGKYNIERIGGIDRYETATKIAYKLLGLGYNKDEIIISNGSKFSDALTVAPYSIKRKLPILLVKENTYSNYLEKYIKDNSIQKVTYVGGNNSISFENRENISKLGVKTNRSFSGVDRYETSIMIAKEFSDLSDTMFLTSGQKYYDILSSAVLAGKHTSPLLLTKKEEIPYVLNEYVLHNKIKNVYIIGGKETVRDNAIPTITGATYTRIAGADRYETAIMVSKKVFGN